MCEMNERNVCIIQWLFCLKCGYAYEYMYPNVKIGWHMYVEEWGMESRLPVSQSVSRSFSLPNEGYETGTLWKLLHVICHVHGSKRRDWTHALAHSLTHISNRRNEEKTGRIISFFSLSLHILFAWWWIENISRVLLYAMRLIIEFIFMCVKSMWRVGLCVHANWCAVFYSVFCLVFLLLLFTHLDITNSLSFQFDLAWLSLGFEHCLLISLHT